MPNVQRKIAKLPTIRRLPTYLHLLRELHNDGMTVVSGTLIAERLQLEPIQVRKDLAVTGIAGKPRVGFDVPDLIAAIEAYLGWDNTTEAVLVGVGSLGTALLGFSGFARHRLKILAAFDANPAKVAQEVHDTPVLPMTKLVSLIKRLKIRIGIITVPAEHAQAIADLLVSANISAIWNFTPVTLVVPAGVIVQNEDLSSGLAVLSKRVRESLHAHGTAAPQKTGAR